MPGPLVLIFHRPAAETDPPLVRLLAGARRRLAESQAALLVRAGATEVRWVERADDRQQAASFGEALAAVAPVDGGVIVLGSGAVPRLGLRDARRLVDVCLSGESRALTNNRYSSDVCAVGDGRALRRLPPLPSDNALPRWLEERAGFAVSELPSRERLALDIDTVQDLALWALAPDAPRWASELVARERLGLPRRDELRALTTDPHAELLVFGRAGSATLRWLERNVRCRVRFLAEERGLRAASPLAIAEATSSAPAGEGAPAARRRRPPRATLGRLLERDGAGALAAIIGELADGAVIDSRVLLADRLGADEDLWPAPADRYASDLLRPAEVADPWLRGLTESAAASSRPILLGAHTLVGPGVRVLLG